ncbi:MAG: histidinol-phosphate aminotransferase [Thermosediminibacterales bacterium]|nr:histidinol-phosphate aminotransferase [Thermosediminibacterales bacterium]MDK2835907.1 histidinol-phosphate aminotransferase [Thermosediminibacterales bacterium]
MDVLELVRPDVIEMEPYRTAGAKWDVKLDANESPFDLDENIKKEIWEEVSKEEFCRYYDPAARQLCEAISEYVGVNPDQVVVGNGSDEIIYALLMAFAGPNREVIIPTPTFPVYKTFTMVSGAIPLEVPLIEKNGLEWQLDIKGIKNKFSAKKNQVLFLCYPNNPTGNYFPYEEIMELIQEFQGLIVIDEAYYEFGKKSFVNMIKQYPNIAIIRTFSKAFCLAGLRAGYLVADENVVDQIFKVKLPYNVSMITQKAAITVLKHRKYIEELTEKIIELREALYNSLKEIEGVYPFPSDTNFILCRFDKSRDFIHDELKRRGISIRRIQTSNLDDHLRISVGTKEQNEKLCSELKKIIEGMD